MDEPPQTITASCNVKRGRRGGRGRKVLVWGWHNVTTRGNMLVERHCNKWDSALRNKNKKTHHNSCRAQRKPEGGGERRRGKKWKPSGNLSCLPRFQPRPLSPHPRNRECERGGGGGDQGDSRGGKHDLGRTANTSQSVYPLKPG